MTTRLHRYGLLLAASLLAMSLVAAFAIANEGSRKRDPVAPNHGKVSKVDWRLVSQFAVFRRATQSAAHKRRHLPSIGRRRGFGLNIKLARVARTVRTKAAPPKPTARASSLGATTEYPLMIVPGAGWVCLTSIPTANLCGPIASATEGALVGWGQCGTIPDGKVAFYGLLPDGVSSLQMQLSDGQRRSIQLINNVFYTELAATELPQSLSWERNGRSYSRDFHFPPDVSNVVCARD